MTKTDVLNGLAAKPAAFKTPGGFDVLLRPLRFGDKAALLDWHREAEGKPGASLTLTRKLVALAVCDQGGNLLLTEDEVGTLDSQDAEAIAAEVTRRSGIGATDPGKSSTPNSSSPATSP